MIITQKINPASDIIVWTFEKYTQWGAPFLSFATQLQEVLATMNDFLGPSLTTESAIEEYFCIRFKQFLSFI